MAEFPMPPFDCAPGLRLSTHEKVSQIQLQSLERRQQQLEQMLERLERRLWFTLYGVAAVILTRVFQSFLAVN
ncbi:hypothetical protein [Phaeobacter sp. 11ANDIMAR09]|uniref:GTA head formation protein, RCAP_rcc01685 family n=1 Tax=Phaeobacter sp. 11ANDIMAR09 TaxID=1225647 RepID=UPI0006C89F7D|nr:hypothetical protein [Phaeobacter sp. 11ANDIMAR09]KPD12404.1 hypothetical protein AN476_10890 [Phaeobacter sp. 11ANDIMAR09]